MTNCIIIKRIFYGNIKDKDDFTGGLIIIEIIDNYLNIKFTNGEFDNNLISFKQNNIYWKDFNDLVNKIEYIFDKLFWLHIQWIHYPKKYGFCDELEIYLNNEILNFNYNKDILSKYLYNNSNNISTNIDINQLELFKTIFKNKIDFIVERYIYKDKITLYNGDFDLITLTISKNKIYLLFLNKIYFSYLDLNTLSAISLLQIIIKLLDKLSNKANYKDLIMTNFDLSINILEYIINNNLLPDYEFYDYHYSINHICI